jgi:hypothetical protein
MRNLSLIIFICAIAQLSAADNAANNPGYQFQEKSHYLYLYSYSQNVRFKSAGDVLDYKTSLTWKFAVSPIMVQTDKTELAVTILRVQAQHQGPGSRRNVDSHLPAGENGADDPLIGHLIASAGAELQVTLIPNTGKVVSVTGGDAIVTRINKLVPPPFPGDPPPLEAAAKNAFSDAALTRMWQQIFSLPSAANETIAFNSPLNGSYERQWTGMSWKDALPVGTNAITATLLTDPTPLSVTINELTGQGTRDITDGVPGKANGTMSFKMQFQALTQPVVQEHIVQWELVPLFGKNEQNK